MKKIIICVVFILMAIILIIIKYKSNYNNKEKINSELSIECLDERQCIYTQDTVAVGNNEKELDNGYYDVLFKKDVNTLTVNVNKLWRTTFNEKLYEDEYVMFVARNILKYINNEVASDVLEKYIIEGYFKSKDGLEYVREIKLKSQTVLFTSKNHELLIEVKNN